MFEYRSEFHVAKMAEVLKVSRSGFYSWMKREPSSLTKENDIILKNIRDIFEKSKHSFGSKKIKAKLEIILGRILNHKRVERLMHENNIFSKVTKKYKATTNSHHDLPVAENILNREFEAEKPNKKMVSDITYIPTDEGWLYAAGVMDLCGRKFVGLSMGERMTKELVCQALEEAILRIGRVNNCILHSDRGSQYCSHLYRSIAERNGFISSMSRKGNCWDNAPMESFWGKLKQEWLNDCHFRNRSEARAAVFEYVWIFYNRERPHEVDDYLTPEQFYNSHCAA